MQYAGLDWHRKFSQITVENKEGKVTGRYEVPHYGSKRTKTLAKLLKLPIEVAVEACGGWYSIVDDLEEMGAKVHLAHPLKTRLIAEARMKNDKIDSKALADLLRTNFLPEAYIPSKEVRRVREILRHRIALVRIRTQLKNKVHAILIKNGILTPYSDLFGVAGRKFLEKLKLPKEFKEPITHYLELMDHLNTQIEEIEKEIRSRVKKEPLAKLLMTIPGIGYFSALLILYEIADINRFANPKKLYSYSGLVSSLYQSADKVRYGRITKQGNKWLRWVLIQNAPHAVRKDPRLRRMYQRIAKRKGKNTAKVAVARELLQAIYYILKKKEPYRPKGATFVRNMVS